MRNQKGVSMITLVITIVVILILASVSFVSSLKTIEETSYSKYVTDVSQVTMAFEETSVIVKGQKIKEKKKKDMEQIYNYVAKNGDEEKDFVKLEDVPKYTIIKNEGQLGIDLPEIMVESGTDKKVPVKYATTEKGTIFTWPPLDYDNKLWITDEDTVEDKMQTQITVGDEIFEIIIDPEDGSLLEWPEKSLQENPDDDDGNETPSEHEHVFYSKVQTEDYFCSDATCVLGKQYYYKCISCDAKGSETYTVGTPLGHLWGAEEVTKEANCTEKGISQSKCSRCESAKNTDIPINTANHHGGELAEITKPATCQEEGTKTYKCESCKFVLRTESIAITEHNMDKVETTKEASCTEKGTKAYKCSTCDKEMKTEEIDALGHDWDAEQAPRKCNRCGLEEMPTNITYKVVYKSTSGADLGTATVTHSYGTTNTITAPSKTGYETPASKDITWDSTEEKTITFMYNPIEYNVTFTLNGGSGVSDRTYTIETTTFTLGTPSKTGYTFTGWTGDNGGTPQKNVSIAKGSTGDKKYTANWEANSITYNVVYESTSGIDLGSTTVEKEYGTTNTITAPAKTGYKTPASKDVTWDSTTAKTITFEYEPIEYSVVFTLNGGTGVTNTTYTIETENFTLGTPSKAGYTFVGWTGDNGNNPQTTVTITKGTTGNKEYTANWEANSITYNVVYKSTSGADLGEATVTYNYGTTNTIVAPEKNGYTTPASQDVVWDSTTAKTIEFLYEPIEYKVTFNLNGGSGITDTTYTTETEDFTLGTPVRLGYEFTGWTGSNGESPEKTITIAKGSTGNKNYTANYVANIIIYNVVYKSTSGKELGTSTVEKEFSTTNVITASEILGYNTPASQTVTWDSVTPKTITFVYEPIEYNVTFTLNGGTGVSNRTYTIETDTFTGWTGENGNTAQTSVSIPKGSTGDKSYTANWSTVSYDVTIDCNGGTGVYNTTYTIETENFTLGTPIRIGYEFTGWTGDNGITPEKTVTIEKGTTGDKNYKANWAIVNYTITYELNDGTLAIANPTTYTIETETFTLNNPSKEGYTFAGWTGSNNTTPETTVSITKGSTENKNYEANWTVNGYEYNVVYQSTSGADLGTTTVLKEYGTTNEITAPEKEGYKTPASQTVTWDSTEAKTITFTYEPMEYSVTIGCNGGSGVSSTSYTIESETFTLGTPEREGYTFTGWTGDNGSNPETTVTIETGSTGARNYFANWDTITYDITFDLAGGTGVSDRTYTIETETFTLGTPEKEGYTFTGWTGSNGDTAQTSVSLEKGSTGDKSYTANWKPTSYSITIDCNGGSGVSSTSYTIETETFTLGTPTRDGYEFTGWTDINGVTYESVTIEKGSIGARNYTANWEANNIAQAIYSEDDQSLTFVKDKLYAAGDTFVDQNGKTKAVTSVESNIETREGNFTLTFDENNIWNYEGDCIGSGAQQKTKSIAFRDVITPSSTSGWFFGFSNCEQIDLTNLDTSKVTNMSGMFCGAGENATTFSIVGLDELDTSKVTDMSGMFSNAGSFADTVNIGDISDWDTSNVTDMKGMFIYFCNEAEAIELDLSGWDATKVIDMKGMFEDANLHTIKTPKNIPTSVDITNITSKTFYDITDGYKEYAAGTFPVGNGATSHTLTDTKPDTTKPNLTAEIPEATNKTSITVSGTATDDSGIESVTVNSNKVTVDANGNWTTEVSVPSENTVVTVVATDTADNTSTITKTVIYDVNVPTVTFDDTPDTEGKTTVTVSGTVTDDISGIGSFTVNGNEATVSEDGKWSAEVSASDANYLLVVATDKAGNAITICNDDCGYRKGSGTCQYHISSEGGWFTDNDGIATLKFNGVEQTADDNGYYDVNIYYVEGENENVFEFVDNSGREFIYIEKVIYDPNDPTVTFNDPDVIDKTANTAITVSGTVMDDISGIESFTFTYGSKEINVNEDGSWETEVIINYDESLNFSVTATDRAGNEINIGYDYEIMRNFKEDPYYWYGYAGDYYTSVEFDGVEGTLDENGDYSTTVVVEEGKNTFIHKAIETDGTQWLFIYNVFGIQEYVDFTVTADNRSKIGYTGEEGENLVIPETFQDTDGTWYKVTGIDDYAFDGCSELTSVTIPGTVETIGDGALGFCDSLTTITIQEGVKTIYADAFYYCGALTSVTIPSSVTTIVSTPFRSCENLTNVTVNSDNSSYCTVNNVLYTKDMKTILACPGSKSGTFTIPSGVTEIGSFAFDSCEKLTSISIPTTVKTISGQAFNWCTGLTNLTIPNSVTHIYHQAFWDCHGLTTINIPSSVTYIGSNPFVGCTGLTSITVDTSNSYFVAVDGVLFDKAQTRLINYPASKTGTSYTVPTGVTTIDSSAFYSAQKLTSVTLPDSLTTLGSSAFERCNQLTSITIPSKVTEISSGTFMYCYSLESITIPVSVTKIGGSAFYNCSKLTSVYYKGTSEQWSAITIGSPNTNLTSATKYYNS